MSSGLPLLYAQARPDATLEPGELCRFFADRVAGFMVPSYVWIVERLPLTPTEKVAKRSLSREIGPEVWRRP